MSFFLIQTMVVHGHSQLLGQFHGKRSIEEKPELKLKISKTVT